MSRITDVFKQQKAGLQRQGRQGKKPEPELPGFTADQATTNADISEQERVLRAFDLATQFGPCAGMTRLERWERAQKFGLDPPAAVRELLLSPEGGQWSQPLWHGRI